MDIFLIEVTVNYKIAACYSHFQHFQPLYQNNQIHRGTNNTMSEGRH